MSKFRQSVSDPWLLAKLKAHDAISHAFANVRPTDALMSLVRKTLAWANQGAKR